jgi:hypothetical protein
MSRELRTFAGALYNLVWVFVARTKAEAGRLLYDLIPEHMRRETSRAALSRYVAPVFWCPKRRRLWFEMAVAVEPRPLHPDRIPAELWGGIAEVEAESLAPSTPYGDDLTQADVTAAEIRKRAGRGCVYLDAARHVGFARGLALANDSAALRVAQQIDSAGDFSAMPILADALEEAGCTSEVVLRHCREATKHVRGCWVVAMVLGS